MSQDLIELNKKHTKRFYDAYLIWNGGASNPRAVARAMVEAIDTASNEGKVEDAAVHLILDHLCFLCFLCQPMTPEQYNKALPEVAAKSKDFVALRRVQP